MKLTVAREAAGLDQRLTPLGAEGRRVECPLEAMRILHFPNMDDPEAAGELRD